MAMIYENPPKIIEALAGSASATSSEFKGDQYGNFTLDAYTTGTLAGTWAIRRRVNPNGSMVAHPAAPFASNPTGSAWHEVQEFTGASAAIYDLVFTRTSGTGDIVVFLRNIAA